MLVNEFVMVMLGNASPRSVGGRVPIAALPPSRLSFSPTALNVRLEGGSSGRLAVECSVVAWLNVRYALLRQWWSIMGRTALLLYLPYSSRPIAVVVESGRSNTRQNPLNSRCRWQFRRTASFPTYPPTDLCVCSINLEVAFHITMLLLLLAVVSGLESWHATWQFIVILWPRWACISVCVWHLYISAAVFVAAVFCLGAAAVHRLGLCCAIWATMS